MIIINLGVYHVNYKGIRTITNLLVSEKNKMRREWIAAFYPSDVFEDPRLKTILCLLYDKVIIHFPITDMACGGGSGISDEYSDDPLVEEGILDLREELLLEEIEYSCASEDEVKGANFFDLNITGMAL